MTTHDAERDWQRDIGPYYSPEQARRQFDGMAYGMPEGDTAKHLAFNDGLMLTGLYDLLSPYEETVKRDLLKGASPETIQVITGWLIRAFMLGNGHPPLPASALEVGQGAISGSGSGYGQFAPHDHMTIEAESDAVTSEQVTERLNETLRRAGHPAAPDS
jgi:hypothetical protein